MAGSTERDDHRNSVDPDKVHPIDLLENAYGNLLGILTHCLFRPLPRLIATLALIVMLNPGAPVLAGKSYDQRSAVGANGQTNISAYIGTGDATSPTGQNPPGAMLGEFLVKFKPGTAAADRQSVIAQSQAQQLGEIPGLGIARMRAPSWSSTGEMVSVYGANPNVQYAEPNYVRTAAASPPNDPYLTSQWSMTKVNANEAWAISTGTQTINIAVLDSGVDNNHADLIPNIMGTAAQDDNGHGTLVAGVAAAATNNATGISSLCWRCKITSYKVLDSFGHGDDYLVASAITAASDAGARVINMSLGAYSYSQTLLDAVNYASTKGVLMVAASGNDGSTRVFYPAAFPQVISTGSSDSNDLRSSSSNYGPTLKVVAPGVNVGTTKLGNVYGSASGTSLASPMVASLAGLVFSINPRLTPEQVTGLIQNGADDLGAPGRDDQFGYGRINACKTVALVLNTGCGGATSAGTPTPTATMAPATATPAGLATATLTPTATASTSTKTGSFKGTVSATGTAQRDHTINVTTPGTISASLGGWSGKPSTNNLDLYLLDSRGTQLATAATISRPEVINYSATAAGTYILRVVVKSGSGSYTLGVMHP